MATGYIFTKTGNSSTKVVHVTNDVVDLGRTKIFKGPVLIEENDSSLISIKEGGGNAMSLNIGAIVTIDGSAPAGTMEGVIDQLDAVFPDASTTGGSGGGLDAAGVRSTALTGFTETTIDDSSDFDPTLTGNKVSATDTILSALKKIWMYIKYILWLIGFFPRYFNVKFYGAKGDGSTDDTAAIQAAINAAIVVYGGEVTFPAGHYMASSALITSVNGINPNCQICMPLIAISSDMVTVKLRGEYPPNFFSEGIAGIPRNTRGVIIESTITGTGSFPSIFGTSYPTTGTGLNYMKLEMENLIIRTSTKSGGTDVAGTMCGVNMSKLSALNLHNVKVDISSSLADSVEPTNETYGVLFPAVNNKAECFVIGDLQVEGYKYGVVITEHLQADRIATYGNVYGLLIPDGYHDFNITHFTAEVNRYSILANGTMEGVIGLYDAEHYILNDKWYKNAKDFIRSSGSSKVTILKANVVDSGFGRNSFSLKSDPNFNYKILTGHGANTGSDLPGTETLLWDDFHRANSASLIGTNNVAWTVGSGTWGITGNKAYAASETSSGSTVFEEVHADVGLSDFVYSVDMKLLAPSSTGAVLFRYVDASNYWYLEMSVGNLTLYKRVSGTFNLVQTITCTNSYANLQVSTIGSGINIRRNGISIYSTDDATFQTATKIGLCVASGTGLGGGVRFANLQVK